MRAGGPTGPVGGGNPLRVAASILLLLATATPAAAQQPLDSLAVRQDSLVLRGANTRWELTKATQLVLVLTNLHRDDGISVQRAALILPENLRCVTRPREVELSEADYGRYVAPQGSVELRFPIGPVRGWCFPQGLAPPRGEADIVVWYTHTDPDNPRPPFAGRVTLAGMAPVRLVLLGAAAGVLLGLLLLWLFRRTGREGAPERRGPVWAELAFGFLVATLATLLIRFEGLPESLYFLQRFFAGSFANGVVLGLSFDLIGHKLIAATTNPPEEPPDDRRDAPEPESPDR